MKNGSTIIAAIFLSLMVALMGIVAAKMSVEQEHVIQITRVRFAMGVVESKIRSAALDALSYSGSPPNRQLKSDPLSNAVFKSINVIGADCSEMIAPPPNGICGIVISGNIISSG